MGTSWNDLPQQRIGDRTPSTVEHRDKLYHGVNSYCTIEFNSESSSEVAIGFVDKVELNRSIDTITETYIGLYGEPSLNAPSNVEYNGTLKKKITDDLIERGGREMNDNDATLEDAGFFTTSITKYKDGGQKADNLKLTWDLHIYTLSKYNKLHTIARGCTITSHKRVMDRANFIHDEYTFKFMSFKQEITNRYDRPN